MQHVFERKTYKTLVGMETQRPRDVVFDTDTSS